MNLWATPTGPNNYDQWQTLLDEAKKEAAETKYWISLVLELGATKEFLNLKQESQELLMILQAIINTMKGKSEK